MNEQELLDVICKHINENIWGECMAFNGNWPFHPINAIVVQYRIRDKAKTVYIDLMQTDPKKWEKIIRKVVYRIEETEVFGHGE